MITIITDSSAYFQKTEAQALGIQIVPMVYQVNNVNIEESFSDCNGEFEKYIRNEVEASTSNAPISIYFQLFEAELKKGNDIICLTISSRLSGAYSAARMAAKHLTGNIEIYDSRLTAGGLYLMAEEVSRLINAGASFHETIHLLPEIKNRISISFSVDDMAPLRRSGRMGLVRMNVGTFLNFWPVLSCIDGIVISDGVAHGETGIMKTLSSRIPADVREIVINYIENHRLATNLYNVIHFKFPDTPIKLRKAGPVLGIHLGTGMISVCCIA